MRSLLRTVTADPAPVILALNHWLTHHPKLLTLAVFAALPDEIDLSSLILAHPHRQWAYPRVCNDQLSFHLVTHPPSQLSPAAFGILEPIASRPEIPIPSIDAFLCPGLAFDPHGGRLGRGKGYYDRMLANARPDALKIGVGYPYQIISNTCSEPHDIHMDEVICGI